MTEAESIDKVLREAEKQGSWAEYAVYMLGDCGSGVRELDNAVEELYIANETMHRVANKLALKHDLDFFEVDREQYR